MIGCGALKIDVMIAHIQYPSASHFEVAHF